MFRLSFLIFIAFLYACKQDNKSKSENQQDNIKQAMTDTVNNEYKLTARFNSFDTTVEVLFWDTKKNMKKLATKFNNNINVCYANEEYEADEEVVSNLKHYLGFPTSYFMNKNLEIIDILRGNPQVPIKTSFAKTLDYNLAFFEERITNFLIQKHRMA